MIKGFFSLRSLQDKMFKEVPYRQKLKYLAIAALILFFVCYKLSVSKTISEYRTYHRLKNVETNAASNVTSLGLLQSKNSLLEKMINRYTLDTINASENLLGVAGLFCNENDLKITEYKPFPVIRTDSISTMLRSITVTGAFADCLQLIYHLETKANIGRVCSVNFKTFADGSTGNSLLACTIFIQNIISVSNETN
jgi:hypothetical protein